MILQEIRETPIWGLFEKGRNFHRRTNIYVDTDRNHRFYNGNQWEGAKLGGIEPIQKNFIKPIVKYKVAVIHDNLYAINYSSQNMEDMAFHLEAERYCGILNRYAHRAWEAEKMDFKGRKVTKDAAINDEGIMYVDFNTETKLPVNEILDKSDVYYGNENDDNIQTQPYILIRKRLPVSTARELAIDLGMDESLEELIVGDNDTFEESGDAAKIEVDDMVTVVYKMYKEKGTVRFSAATRLCTIVEDQDLGISLYPLAHFNWEEKKGSARGEGEVRFLIPNQIEVNRTEMRRVLTVKQQAYPQKVVDETKVENTSALNAPGSIIRTRGNTVDDVRKVVGILQPAQMSPDVKQLQDDLIQVTRELAGAGDSATGQINPETASGRAILAVQQASQAPMTEQKETYKNFLEDIAKIWLEYLIAHSDEGLKMEEEIVDPMSGQKSYQIVIVRPDILRRLQAQVKIDVTPKGVYDRFAQEQTMENLLMSGYFTAEKVSELEAYANALPDDAVAPKLRILEVIDYIKRQQQRIAQIEANARRMQQRMQQFLQLDPTGQAQMVANARSQIGTVAA